jgi:hypothetical protein
VRVPNSSNQLKSHKFCPPFDCTFLCVCACVHLLCCLVSFLDYYNLQCFVCVRAKVFKLITTAYQNAEHRHKAEIIVQGKCWLLHRLTYVVHVCVCVMACSLILWYNKEWWYCAFWLQVKMLSRCFTHFLLFRRNFVCVCVCKCFIHLTVGRQRNMNLHTFVYCQKNKDLILCVLHFFTAA